MNDISFKHTFEIVEFNKAMNKEFDVLLGTDILRKMNIGLTGVAYKYPGSEDDYSLRLKEDAQFENRNFDTEQLYEPNNSPYGTKEEQDAFMKHIQSAIDKNQNIPTGSFCTVPESVVRLPMKDCARSHTKQYPIAHRLMPDLEKQINEWLDAGIIIKHRANTSFNSPLLLVPKKDENNQITSHRVCLDVRGINKLIPDVVFPVPKIRSIFDNLAGGEVFTKIDLKNAYNSFLVHPEDQHKLCFQFKNQTYTFQGCCFGLKTVTAIFCKVMKILFEDMDFIETYVDDCVIKGTAETHTENVRRVIERLTSVNLKINVKKCSWYQRSIYLLGFVVESGGIIKVDPRRLTNIDNWPIPRTKKDVMRLMGIVSYMRDFVPLISRIAAPIDRLRTDLNVELHWTQEHTDAFVALKEILKSKTLLHTPDLSKKFYVATDASKYGVGAVLTQRDEHGRTLHIAFASKALSPSQREWGTTKRELYAVVFALQKFRELLWGNKFELRTDHKALTYLHTQAQANPMMIGWIETLLDFNFDVVHIKGILNQLPDLLSRLYEPCLANEFMLGGGEAGKKSKEKGKRNQKENRRMQTSHAVVKQKVIYSRDRDLNTLAVKVNKFAKAPTAGYLTPPEEKRAGLLKDAHNFGHFGSTSIVEQLHSQGIHWNNIYKGAAETVKSCIECQRHNISKRGYHPLKNIVAYLPFDHIGIDLLGPLPVTRNGNIFVLVVIDVCTRYTIIRPLKNKQSDTVAIELIKIFGDYGIPKIIQSDNGREFKNSLMHSLSKHLGIDRRYNTAFHSRGNGVSESAVKTTLNTIRKMVNSNSNDWDNVLPIVQLASNYKIKYRSKSAPFSLMYARRLNDFKDYSDPSMDDQIPNRPMNEVELAERIDRMYDVVFPAIRERTQRLIEEESRKFNDKNVIIDIPNGTAVMVRLPGRTSKLAPLYEGPFIVVRKTQGGSYVLKDEQNELLHRDYVPSELKVVSIDETAIEDEVYEVEDIRDHRGGPGQREYLVKWAGYGERENTWEKASSFTSTVPIDNYWKKKRELEKLSQERKAKLITDSEHTTFSTSTALKNTDKRKQTEDMNVRRSKRNKN